MAGYIKLYRDIQHHWLFAEKRIFSRYEAWIDILLRVNHTPKKISQNGKPELVERGSTIWSMGDMEERWGWSNRKVKRFLDCLVDDQMLVYKSTTKKTYLTVINYDKYQGSDTEEAPPMHQESISNAYQKHTNKNVKNEKKDIDKIQYLENVRMTEVEYNKLGELMGEKERERYMNKFNAWITGQSPSVQKRRSAYLSITTWYKDSDHYKNAKKSEPVLFSDSELDPYLEEAYAKRMGKNTGTP